MAADAVGRLLPLDDWAVSRANSRRRSLSRTWIGSRADAERSSG